MADNRLSHPVFPRLDDLLDWPGKAEGLPCPPIIWLHDEAQLHPSVTVKESHLNDRIHTPNISLLPGMTTTQGDESTPEQLRMELEQTRILLDHADDSLEAEEQAHMVTQQQLYAANQQLKRTERFALVLSRADWRARLARFILGW